MYRCLVIVDLQNDYFPGGKMELFGIKAAAENARILLTEFRKSDSPIIHIQHISLPPDAFFFLPDTQGAQLNERVSPRDGETVVVKIIQTAFAAHPSWKFSGVCISTTSSSVVL
jgi:nicotinamidase-related amidase